MRQDDGAVHNGLHAALLFWVALLLTLSEMAPGFYLEILQEDRFVEWLTATLFIAAGIVRLRAAGQTRRVFDGLIGLFCIFVGGEEFSWGQRLFGFMPPAVFLERNTQQEFTVHNFAAVFGEPKGVLILALLGYGLLLPLARRTGLRHFLDRAGASAPSFRLMPWFVIGAALLIWYPVDLTGEWVEALAATLFLAAAPSTHRRWWFAVAAVAAVALTLISARGITRSRNAISCARTETRALLHDIATLLEADADLFQNNVHKRLYSTIQAGYLPDVLINYEMVPCGGEAREDVVERRRYGLDPWGMAYWVKSELDTQNRVVITVYSFGANRKRDDDDVASYARIE